MDSNNHGSKNKDKPQFLTQGNAVGLHSVFIVTCEGGRRKHVDPIKNTGLYQCRTFFSPLACHFL